MLLSRHFFLSEVELCFYIHTLGGNAAGHHFFLFEAELHFHSCKNFHTWGGNDAVPLVFVFEVELRFYICVLIFTLIVGTLLSPLSLITGFACFL